MGNMRVRLRMGDGVVVNHGEHYDFPEYHPLQRALLPVVSTVDPTNGGQVRKLRTWPEPLFGMGTAVCIGAGWFLTAKHVVQPFDRVHSVTKSEKMFVIFETDTELTNENDVLGGAFAVRGYDQHPDCDLATLTAELPRSAESEIRTLDMSLRMPAVGEPVAAAGYPELLADVDLREPRPRSMSWARTLRASVGAVTEQRPDRQGGWYQPGPGFLADVATFPGMSGGPVLDERNSVVGFVSSSMKPGPDNPDWSSFVSL